MRHSQKRKQTTLLQLGTSGPRDLGTSAVHTARQKLNREHISTRVPDNFIGLPLIIENLFVGFSHTPSSRARRPHAVPSPRPYTARMHHRHAYTVALHTHSLQTIYRLARAINTHAPSPSPSPRAHLCYARAAASHTSSSYLRHHRFTRALVTHAQPPRARCHHARTIVTHAPLSCTHHRHVHVVTSRTIV